jgi:hypothetical protein
MKKKLRMHIDGTLLTFATVGTLVAVALSWNGIYFRLAHPPNQLRYLGSSSCESCHRAEHAAWQDSLHRKMMRNIQLDGEILADFDGEHAPNDLIQEDIKWVIGSKWEQQYMGHDGITETLLPGAWKVRQAAWKQTAWDGWAEPRPLHRCHGCHTVGLDVDSGQFVEAGIGCESCHGPGEWHVKSRGIADIHTGLEAEQCGQCHVRGRSTDGSVFYPKGFKPGGDLNSHLVEWQPDYIQNSSAWWGNGRERTRHQEFTAWKVGGHVNALKSLLEGYEGQYGQVTAECLSCHAAEAAVNPHAEPIKLADARNGVTCTVCHTSHGALESTRIDCAQCHDRGAYHHQTEPLAQHIPCPNEANVQCAHCHMPKTVRMGGEYRLHSHHPGIVPPSDTQQFGVPNSCANGGCHSKDSIEEQIQAFQAFYGTRVLTQETLDPSSNIGLGAMNAKSASGQ